LKKRLPQKLAGAIASNIAGKPGFAIRGKPARPLVGRARVFEAPENALASKAFRDLSALS
jgi:hypothetical protein